MRMTTNSKKRKNKNKRSNLRMNLKIKMKSLILQLFKMTTKISRESERYANTHKRQSKAPRKEQTLINKEPKSQNRQIIQ